MIRLWQTHKIALTGFVLAALVTGFFLVRLMVQSVYWSDPKHHDLTPQPWMTVGYVGRSWGLDPRRIDAEAGFPPPHSAGHPLTLEEIAARRGVPVEQVIAELQATIAGLRAPRPEK